MKTCHIKFVAYAHVHLANKTCDIKTCHKVENSSVTGLRWLPTVLIVQHTIVFKKPLFHHLAKYDHETQPHNCYNIANYEK